MNDALREASWIALPSLEQVTGDDHRWLAALRLDRAAAALAESD